MQSRITEWASPNFHSADYRALFLLLLATFTTLAFSGRKTRLRDLLLLLAGTAGALLSARMIPLFVLVAVPLVARAITDWIPSGKTHSASPTIGFALSHGTVLLLMVVFAGVHTFAVIQCQPRAEAAVFPSAAVAYLRRHPPLGPIFNYYSWGGYLIFKFYPRIPVFIDGRADVYGEGLTQYSDMYFLQKNWRQPLSQWKVTTVIVQSDCPLASGLGELPDWSLNYRDSVSAVFSKSH